MDHEWVRAFALALPETSEAPHHEISSFRVRGKIFATVPDAGHLNILLEEIDAHAAVSLDPVAVALVPWGAKIAGVRVDLAAVDEAHLRQLLTDAWRRRAPAALRDRV